MADSVALTVGVNTGIAVNIDRHDRAVAESVVANNTRVTLNVVDDDFFYP